MLRGLRWMSLFVVALVLMCLPLSQAATVTGGAAIHVKVLDASGKPVVGAKVGLIVLHRRSKDGAAGSAGHSRPQPIATGVTDDNGVAVLSNVSSGNYAAIAGLKGGGVGHERVRITGGSDASVTITLRPHTKGNNSHSRPGKSV